MTIKELRTARMMSQAQFADKIGIDRSDLGKYENGKKKIGPTVILKIKDAFGVEIDAQDGVPKKKAEKQPQAPEKKPEKQIQAPEKKLVKKIQAPDLAIYIQSPLGGNITPEEIRAMVPKDAESCFVRVDQNKVWWLKPDGTTGFVWIWE